MDVEATIRDYLHQILHMSLATCSNERPWVCEVHFVFDNDLNLYFRSTPARRHSQEIAANPQVAGNIITQHLKGQKVRGVYFEGVAKMLENVTADDVAYKLTHQRLGAGEEILIEALKEDGHKFYKIAVSDFYLFDSRQSDPSQKYHLLWKAN